MKGEKFCADVRLSLKASYLKLVWTPCTEKYRQKRRVMYLRKSAYLCASNITLTMCASQSIIGRKGKKSILALVTSTVPIYVGFASTLAIDNVTHTKAANGTGPVASAVFAPRGVPLLQIPIERFALIANPALHIGLAST